MNIYIVRMLLIRIYSEITQELHCKVPLYIHCNFLDNVETHGLTILRTLLQTLEEMQNEATPSEEGATEPNPQMQIPKMILM